MGAGGDVGRHQLVHLEIQRRGAVPGQRVNHVAFGEHAGELAPAVEHDERADALLVELADRGLHRVDRADGGDVAAFAVQDLGNGHGSLLRGMNGRPFNRW